MVGLNSLALDTNEYCAYGFGMYDSTNQQRKEQDRSEFGELPKRSEFQYEIVIKAPEQNPPILFFVPFVFLFSLVYKYDIEEAQLGWERRK